MSYMIRRTLIARLFAAAALVAASAGTADAGLLPVSVSVNPEAGNFRWAYSVVLPSDMKLQSGSYFTIYDFAGYVEGSASVLSAMPEGATWTITTSNLGSTPGGVNPVDDPTKTNLTFMYSGPTVPNGSLGLGNFIATSLYGEGYTPPEDSPNFAATNPRALDGVTDANVTNTTVPVGEELPPPIGTPEPTTLALAGLGLPLIGLARYIRRRGQPAVA
jgi:hypothetical protein